MRGERRKPRKCQRCEIAAFAGCEAVHLVHDHRAQARKKPRRIRLRKHQHQAFRCGEENIRRGAALAGALCRRCIACAAFNRDGKPHLRDGPHEVALNVVGQRLQRRDVKRVDALCARLVNVDERWQEARKGLAAAGRRDEQRRLPRAERLQHRALIGMRLPAAAREPGFHIRRQAGPWMQTRGAGRECFERVRLRHGCR